MAAPAPAPEVTTAAGLVVSADLRDNYVTGFPMLVELIIRNDTASSMTFPDLSARPWLVRFQLVSAAGRKQERYTTPPAQDRTDTWTIPARGQRRVLLEIPASSTLAAGGWTLTVHIADPAGSLSLPARAITLSAAQPQSPSLPYEPTVAAATGAMGTWLQSVGQGYDLYLQQSRPGAPNQLYGLFYLAHLAEKAEPTLSWARASEASSRYVYWAEGNQAIGYVRLDGTRAQGQPRTVAVPYPTIAVLGRGVTDSTGGLMVPVWVPAPSGASGSVKVLSVDSRGGTALRSVAELSERPTVVETGVDASGALLLAMAHSRGVDLYRADPTLATELPARGVRVAAAEADVTTIGLRFDVLPAEGERAGGLSLLTLASTPSGARTRWYDLAGKPVIGGSPTGWTVEGTPIALAPDGAGPLYVLSQDSAGALWYSVFGGTRTKLADTGSGSLWFDKDVVYLRTVSPSQGVTDRVVGPRQQ